MKSLWNRIQAQLETQNKIHCKSRQVQNPPVEFQQDFSGVFSVERTPAETERLGSKHQRKIKAANRLSGKQGLEDNQLIKQLNQPDTGVQIDAISLENTKLIPSTSKKVPPQQVARSEFGFLHHSPFMSVERMLLVLPQISLLFKRIICVWKHTVLFFFHFL